MFSERLPLTPAIAAQQLPAVEPRTLLGVRVFVAEDEPMLVWALEEVLIDLGCTVVGTAGRVTEALAFVATNTFDIAILDGALEDGPIDQVVKLLASRGTPIVIASGLSPTDTQRRFGHVTTVQKPYKDIDLQSALLAALG